jgi:hypothetical protein
MPGTYRTDTLDRDQLAKADPYGGRGLFLAMDEPGDVILAALEEAAGAPVPACAFGGHGAWVDTGAPAVDRERLLSAWKCGRADA